MKALGQFEVWLLAGNQEMYGSEVLRSSRPTRSCLACPWPVRSGSRGRTSPPPPRRGSRPADRTRRIVGLELLVIDDLTRLREFANELRWNEAYHLLARGAL